MYLSLGGKYIIMKRKFTVNASEQISATRTVDRWDIYTEQYEPVQIPDDWKIAMYSDNMDEQINCVNCGKPMTYGEGYTSRRYHNKAGMGYMECEKCYYDQLNADMYLQQAKANSGIEASTDIMGAAGDDKEDPRMVEVDELHDRVEDDFDYVMTGIERLGREGMLDEAISLLNTLADTLDSAIGIIGNNFESDSSEEI